MCALLGLATACSGSRTPATSQVTPTSKSSAPATPVDAVQRSSPTAAVTHSTTQPPPSQTTTAANTPRYPPCGGVQVDNMSVYKNVVSSQPGPWTMVADVVIQNYRGPDCSLKANPQVVLARQGADKSNELMTSATTSNALPEEVVNLRWSPDGYAKDASRGHFYVYTTRTDSDGTPCSQGHMVEPEVLKITLPGMGQFFANANPVFEGPSLSTCDGRIAVTPIAQLQ